MSNPSYLLAKPLFSRVPVAQLAAWLALLRWAQRISAGTALTVLAVIITQLAYPVGWSRPLLSEGSVKLGLKSQAALKAELERLNREKVDIKVGGKTYTASHSELGRSIDPAKAAAHMASYPVSERLVPFSLFKQDYSGVLPAKIDQAKITALADKIIAENSAAPVNASASRQADGKYALVPAKTGLSFDKAKLMSELAALPVGGRASVQLNGKVEQPAVASAEVESAIKQVEARVAAAITISYGGQNYVLPGDLLLSWSAIQTDPAKGEVAVTYDRNALRTWLSRSLPLVLKSAETSVVTVVNGATTGRTAASAGLGLDLDKTSDAIMQNLAGEAKPASLAAITKTLSPAERVVRSYTPTNQGLQALIADWQNDHSGVRAAVTLQEIGGQGRRAEHNANRLQPTASVYKLFTAYYVMNRIEQGSINPNDQVVNGRNVSQCIEAMIVVSDNPCGLTFGDRYGWSNIDGFIAANGFPATTMNVSPISTTSNEAASFLVRLQGGQLLNGGNTSALLGYMGRQIYRSAIPAGSPGSTVQDKVGFIGNVWNDAGIIYSPRSNYVLVVLTQNGNAAVIKDLAQRVNTLLNQ